MLFFKRALTIQCLQVHESIRRQVRVILPISLMVVSGEGGQRSCLPLQVTLAKLDSLIQVVDLVFRVIALFHYSITAQLLKIIVENLSDVSFGADSNSCACVLLVSHLGELSLQNSHAVLIILLTTFKLPIHERKPNFLLRDDVRFVAHN